MRMITLRSSVKKESVAKVEGAIEKRLSAIKHERPNSTLLEPI
jgi:hypothetical protein